MHFKNAKLALITGASSGLGLALAKALDERGIPLLLSARGPSNELPHAEWILCDLAKTREPLLQAIQQRAPDLLINNAGFTIYGDCLDEYASQEEIFAVNAKAPFELALEAARVLKEQKRGGVILNIGSAASLFSFPGMATYSASKAFLASFSRSLDAELKDFGIRSLVALPGQISTPFASKAARNPMLSRPSFSMPVEKAVHLLLRQIERRIPYAVPDWRVRLAALVPRPVLERTVRKNIIERLRRVG